MNIVKLLSAASVTSLLATGSALAAFPASILGNYEVRANNSINILMNITSQGTVGSCPQILGTFGDNGGVQNALTGYYCPASGEFSFLRVAGNGLTSQVYSGNATVIVSTPSNYNNVAGSFESFSGGVGNGAFSFSGSDAPPPIIN